MSQQLESELSEALALKASGIPMETGQRLRGIDYHPRTGRTLPRVTVASLAGVAATTGVVASVVILGSSQPAFAGWSPAPTPGSAAHTSAAATACQAQVNGLPALPGDSGAGRLRPVATDVRGPFTLVIYQSGATTESCLSGPSTTIVSRSSEHGDSMSAGGSVSSVGHGRGTAEVQQGGSMMTGVRGGGIKQMTVAHLDSGSQGPYTLVEGQVAAGVTAVTLLRTDGRHIQASTGNGWFVAWWPGDLNTTSALVTTATGVTTQPLDTTVPAPPPPPAGSGSCRASSHSSSVCTGGSGNPGGGGLSTTTRGGPGTAAETKAG